MKGSQICTALLMALAAAPTVGGKDIDYDPRRPGDLRACDEHQHTGRAQQARDCYLRLLDAPSALVRAEAAWALGDLQSANDMFRDLARADPRTAQPRIRRARLFLQTHQYADATQLLREVLRTFPDNLQAKTTLARVLAERFEGEAHRLLDEVAAQNDDLIEAHLLSARMALEEGQLAAAEQALDRAGRIASRQRLPALEVDSLRAALELVRDRDPQPWLRRILDYNPRYGAAWEQLAHFEIIRRRYREANVLLERAVQLQPDLWSAHAELGSNLLRLGQIDAARKHLMTAYSGDPYSPTIVNSLRLLDRIGEFKVTTATVQAGDDQYEVRLRLHRGEAAVLEPYALRLAQQAIETFSRRYDFKLREPLTVEMYPDHDDFAVRVAALPGIGLLGVTFGYLVAMDSPSGRRVGEFHWGSTLWHELAHVFTLEATDHRVPRWLSEGISVFEEWRTGPTPGVAVPADFIVALREGRLLPVSDLDAGFIRPTYPNQVQVSYVQAGLVCLFIEHQWGFERLAAFLRQFTSNRSTASAVQATFQMPPGAFDKQFDVFVRAQFAPLLQPGEEWEQAYEAARGAIQDEQWAVALAPARRAAQLYPQHVGPGSPHLLLAQTLNKLGQRAEAIAALEAYVAAGGWEPTAVRELARWLDEAGRPQQVTALLRALNYADPLNAAHHAQLGERLLAAASPREALDEFSALRVLNQSDEAPALYGAARALRALGDTAASRRHVLDALAAAPHYKPAQDLLLQMIEERTKNE